MEPTEPDALAERRVHAASPQVLLLSVWLDAAGAWHARLTSSDAQLHHFTSPFELAQFLTQLPRLRPRVAMGDGGLR